ncbi:MAG: hypothetical protein A3J27_10255 [Candidatus Tectomicrobia bacterium RIFCSPLOWO2_12_FULL_69_37]|nr:MAG: hypothetical protein A3J27_10255 [Candidatus Tectomicrobia bacterium RIFCSPLOWO2_12_FULL_69_37]
MKAKSLNLLSGQSVIWFLAVLGLVLIVYRFVMGLGAVTNLSDGYPWGIWIGLDILAGIALAAGGFVMAGTVYLLGGQRFHVMARTAVLTAFLGYLLFIFGLIVDLGRPWNIWKPVFNWQHESPMFEVSWCVMLYTFVLFLEMLPSVFERYRLEKLHSLWRMMVPWLIVFILGLFTLAMTHSPQWALAMVAVLLVWEGLIRLRIMPRHAEVSILLIAAGVILSTLHQSSLGSLFLIVPHKLHALWHTPILPLLFFFSAVMVAPAMVIFESLVTERTLGYKAHLDLLHAAARVMPYLLGVYLFLKLADLVGRGAVPHALALTPQAVSWWMEMGIGAVIPLVLFMTPELIRNRAGLFGTSVLVIAGVVWNRLNVAVVGVIVRPWETYYPYWAEVFITVGIISVGLLAFRWAMRNLPIHVEGESPHPA